MAFTKTIHQKQWRAKENEMTSLEYFKNINEEFRIWKNNPSLKTFSGKEKLNLVPVQQHCKKCLSLQMKEK